MKLFSSNRVSCILAVCLVFSLCRAPAAYGAKETRRTASAHPSIQVKEPTYNFGEVTESEEVEHAYPVKNTGKATLEIDRVQTSCGCTIARFDHAIPPGETGQVILKLNLKGYQGKMSKTATILSNDPRNPRVTLKLEGTVIALIDVRPSSNVVFRGMPDQLSETILDLVGAAVPFHLANPESNLGQDITYRLDTVEEGKHYRLTIANKIKRGNYSGYIKFYTGVPQKPDIFIRISGFIEGEISVKPQTILIGKLSAQQPERQGRVLVTSNRDKPFRITQMIYDERFVQVTQIPLEKDAGYSLQIEPKLDGIPLGTRQQTSLSIETDLNPGETEEVQIHLFNSADQPKAEDAATQ